MFKVLDEVCEPRRGTKYSAYVDLFARDDVVIGAGETKVVKLGVKLDLEKMFNHIHKDRKTITTLELENFMRYFYLEVALRSSLAVKGLIIANGIGIIDLDYPDEIGLIVHNPISLDDAFYASQNRSTFGFKISKGDKVAQCTLKEHKGYFMGYKSDVVRDGGFGSTGN